MAARAGLGGAPPARPHEAEGGQVAGVVLVAALDGYGEAAARSCAGQRKGVALLAAVAGGSAVVQGILDRLCL